MIGFYLDSALTKLATRATPKQFLISTKGGLRFTSLWLGDPVAGKTFTFDSNVTIRPYGTLASGVLVSLKRDIDASYNFPGVGILLASNQIVSGVAGKVQIDVQINLAAGALAEFAEWGLQSNGYRLSTDLVSVPRSSADISCSVLRRDQALPQRLRLLPAERALGVLPGFLVGEYRWRDASTINAQTLVPTNWDVDTSAIGVEKFIAGIGHADDLEPQQIEESTDSLFLRIKGGQYFTGPNRYFLPADPKLEFFPVTIPAATVNNPEPLPGFVLSSKPKATKPLFIGTWKLDGQGYYEKDTEYRRAITTAGFDGLKRFYLDLKTLQVTLSESMAARTLYLGMVSGNPRDYFDLPIYPVDKVDRVFIDTGLGHDDIPCLNVVFDAAQGTLVVPKAATATQGQPVYAVCQPAVAVLWENGTTNTRLLPVDVNPAFSGISGGYIYMQHRRQRASSIVLACDKPLIPIPATYTTITGLVAYGPVYQDGDYALLMATSYGQVQGETVPGARLRVLTDPGFTGLINYRDPTTEVVEVVTGGDGTANFIFTPKNGFGNYLATSSVATTTVANDSLILPADVDVSQVISNGEWMVSTYSVLNNDSLSGKVGSDPTLGEIAWAVSGTAGTVSYKTNGLRSLWVKGSTSIRPIKAIDLAGKNYLDTGFSGKVHKLVFATAVPLGVTVGAYFVAYVQRITLRVQAANSNVISNSILLQIDVPTLSFVNPWLKIADATNGRINQYRLGWGGGFSFNV